MAKRPAHDYARVDKHVPVSRRAATSNPYSPVMILISLNDIISPLPPVNLGRLSATRYTISPRARVVMAR